MVAGKSTCKKCCIEFKWYRNPNQGPAKYCSKKCKDEDYEVWQFKSDKKKIIKCTVCGKEFEKRVYEYQSESRFCSKECMSTQVHTWHKKNRFVWDLASEEDKKKRMIEKFEKYVIRQDGCWDWKGVIHHSGYAPIKLGKQMLAHIVSWIIHKGEIKENLLVLHKCDNRKCTNPDHLYIGTQKDNAQDREERNRSNPRFGENHPHSKLTVEKVKEIKKLIKIGVKLTKISFDFEISHGALRAIKNGITWKHVNP